MQRLLLVSVADFQIPIRLALFCRHISLHVGCIIAYNLYEIIFHMTHVTYCQVWWKHCVKALTTIAATTTNAASYLFNEETHTKLLQVCITKITAKKIMQKKQGG